MSVAVSPPQTQVEALLDFARHIRANNPDETDEQLADVAATMATELRRHGFPEWPVFAALAGVLRQGVGS
jgi:hypothetical protein